MKQTTNYHLNQWDPGDRLLRTDFNGDNGKIDAAIRAAENRINSFSNQLSSTVSNVNNQINSAMSNMNSKLSTALSTVDNKIAAVEGKVGLKLIRTVNATQTMGTTTIPLGSIDWTKYSKVHFEVEPFTSSGGTVAIYPGNGNNYLDAIVPSGHGRVSTMWCTTFPMYSESRNAGMLAFSNSSSKFAPSNSPCRDLNSFLLGVSTDVTVYSSSVVRIYGEE